MPRVVHGWQCDAALSETVTVKGDKPTAELLAVEFRPRSDERLCMSGQPLPISQRHREILAGLRVAVFIRLRADCAFQASTTKDQP